MIRRKLRSIARKLKTTLLDEPAPVDQRTFRQREAACQVQRPPFAYGLLKAADVASFFGASRTTVCEFGVAGGAGLLNMIEVADQVTAETGVSFDIFGFDTGSGLTPIHDYRDHPEVWSQGDYPMGDTDALRRKLNGRATLIIGDIAETVDSFVDTLSPQSPLGFISVDVDIYTSSTHVLKVLLGPAGCYNPAVSVYFDDVSHFFANRYCGELLAIEEFNASHPNRKLDSDRSCRHVGIAWYTQMYACHILDHEARSRINTSRPKKVKAGGNLPPGVLN
jgi:hypothetical protein